MFPPLRSFVSRELLGITFFVMLLSSALDQYPADIEPQPFSWNYSLRTREQQARYTKAGDSLLVRDGVPYAPATLSPLSAPGAEDLAVSADGVAFVGLKDGRLVSFTPAESTPELRDFARTGRDSAECGSLEMEPVCGRPLGLVFADAALFGKFLKRISDAQLFAGDQVLLVADAYKGVLLFDAAGKRTLLFNRVDSEPTLFLNSIVFIPKTGQVFVTDSSRRFQRNNVRLEYLERLSTGRLLRFDPHAGRVAVVASDLGFPNGLALEPSGRGLLVALTTQHKVVRYGLSTKTLEDFAFIPGEPDNLSIETVGHGDSQESVLMVGMVMREDGGVISALKQSPKMRKLLSMLPAWTTMSLVQRVGLFATVDLTTGDVRHVYEDTQGVAQVISGVRRVGDELYLTSWLRSSLVRVPAVDVK